VLGRRQLDWSDVVGLRAGDRGDLWLVLDGGRRLRLPTARARHLPLIAAASGGRLPNPLPAPPPASPDAEPAASPEARPPANPATQPTASPEAQ
jgi:hypothetical protein